MGKKLKMFIKPKFKIGSDVWMLKNGLSRSDYFQNPSDDKLSSLKVIGYTVKYNKNKTEISSYKLEGNVNVSGQYNWEFSSKKELKDFLNIELLKHNNR